MAKVAKKAKKRFPEAVIGWSVRQFENWIGEGVAAVADDPYGRSWLKAFSFLLLDEDRDPADQVIAALARLPNVSKLRVHEALKSRIEHLDPHFSAEYAVFLLRLSDSLNSEFRIETVWDVLNHPSVLHASEAWDLVAEMLLEAAARMLPTQDFIVLMDEMRTTRWWKRKFGIWYLRAASGVDFATWRRAKTEFSEEYFQLRDVDPDAYHEIEMRRAALESQAPQREITDEGTVIFMGANRSGGSITKKVVHVLASAEWGDECLQHTSYLEHWTVASEKMQQIVLH